MEVMWRRCGNESEREEKGWNGGGMDGAVLGGIEQSTIAGRLNSAFWLMAKRARADLSFSLCLWPPLSLDQRRRKWEVGNGKWEI
jgi:hypothetical protein